MKFHSRFTKIGRMLKACVPNFSLFRPNFRSTTCLFEFAFCNQPLTIVDQYPDFVIVFFAFLSSFICIFYSRSFCNLSNLSISGTFLCRTINNISCCTIYFLPLVYILHIFFIVLHYILQICKKLQEKKTFQRIVEKSFSHILLNHKAFNRTAGYGHYRVLYQRHF